MKINKHVVTATITTLRLLGLTVVLGVILGLISTVISYYVTLYNLSEYFPIAVLVITVTGGVWICTYRASIRRDRTPSSDDFSL